MDEEIDLKSKALMELKEEISLDEDLIQDFIFGREYEREDRVFNCSWYVSTMLVVLKNKPDIKLDFEHTEYKWVKFEELENFDLVPSFLVNLKTFLNL